MVMIKVSSIMSHRVITVDQDTSLKDAIDIMSFNSISCALVTDKKKKLIGIITERDLVNRLLHKKHSMNKKKVKDIMTKEVISISPNTPLEEASFLMRTKRIKQLPITSKGNLVGIITQTDVVDESINLSSRLRSFMFYQNIQSSVIVLFIAFFIIYFVYKVVLLR